MQEQFHQNICSDFDLCILIFAITSKWDHMMINQPEERNDNIIFTALDVVNLQHSSWEWNVVFGNILREGRWQTKQNTNASTSTLSGGRCGMFIHFHHFLPPSLISKYERTCPIQCQAVLAPSEPRMSCLCSPSPPCLPPSTSPPGWSCGRTSPPAPVPPGPSVCSWHSPPPRPSYAGAPSVSPSTPWWRRAPAVTKLDLQPLSLSLLTSRTSGFSTITTGLFCGETEIEIRELTPRKVWGIHLPEERVLSRAPRAAPAPWPGTPRPGPPPPAPQLALLLPPALQNRHQSRTWLSQQQDGGLALSLCQLWYWSVGGCAGLYTLTLTLSTQTARYHFNFQHFKISHYQSAQMNVICNRISINKI